jgi:hypothetical protein
VEFPKILEKETLLELHLAVAVPLEIAYLAERGGPDEYMHDRVRAWSTELGSQGDAISYHVKNVSRQMVQRLVEALAIMAFQPGGVTFGQLHFQTLSQKTGQMNI